MLKLIKTNFFIAKKSIIIYILFLATILLEITFSCVTIKWEAPSATPIDFASLFITISIPIIICQQYRDATIRIKLITGYKRKQIYLSDLIIIICIGILWWLIDKSVYWIIYSSWHCNYTAKVLGAMNSELYCLYFLIGIISIISLASINVMICDLVTKLKVCNAVCALSFYVIFFIGVIILANVMQNLHSNHNLKNVFWIFGILPYWTSILIEMLINFKSNPVYSLVDNIEKIVHFTPIILLPGIFLSSLIGLYFYSKKNFK